MSTQLLKYDIARKAIAQAVEIDDVAEISNRAEAMRAYAKQIHDTDSEIHMAEIKLRAKRKIGEISRDMETNAGRPFVYNSPSAGVIKSKAQELKQAGISTQEASRCEKIAGIDEDEFEDVLADAKKNNKPITYADVEKKVIGTGSQHTSKEKNEWYTPKEYIESARKVLGTIDVDPASSDIAQETVNAGVYFTKDDSGLDQDWYGNVWLNPPYSHPEIETFTSKIVCHYAENDINAIVLVNNATDTAWFHEMLNECSSICLTKGRINFVSSDGTPGLAARQGQVFFYFGGEVSEFKEEFSQYGKVIIL